MKSFSIIVSVILIVVGISMISSYNELNKSVTNVTTTVFEPIQQIMDDPNYSFNEEVYEKKALNSVADFSIKYIDFERDLTTGIGTFIAGLGLLIFTTRKNLKEFTSKTFDFFIG